MPIRARDVAAFIEPHIEQGPVLEAKGLPVGIVTAINGATRLEIAVDGIAGHAGASRWNCAATPSPRRRK